MRRKNPWKMAELKRRAVLPRAAANRAALMEARARKQANRSRARDPNEMAKALAVRRVAAPVRVPRRSDAPPDDYRNRYPL